jgi:hypothetical protein
MIIGNGDIASILNDRKGAIFFTAGVSNSGCTDDAEYERELLLLLKQPTDKCLFYFSSIASLTDQSKKYYQHKQFMEGIIFLRFPNFNIIRLGNIDWGKNPNTFLNFLRNKIKNGEPVDIKDEYRYMISKEQLLLLTDNLPLTGQNTINAFGYMKKVKDLI